MNRTISCVQAENELIPASNVLAGLANDAKALSESISNLSNGFDCRQNHGEYVSKLSARCMDLIPDLMRAINRLESARNISDKFYKNMLARKGRDQDEC